MCERVYVFVCVCKRERESVCVKDRERVCECVKGWRGGNGLMEERGD